MIWPLGPKFLKKFRWFFGRNDGTQRTFWNQLTFNSKFLYITDSLVSFFKATSAAYRMKDVSVLFVWDVKIRFWPWTFFFASFVSILKCAYYKVKDFRQARASVVDSSKVTIKKNRREPIWLCSLRDHSYITSAKGLGSWVQKKWQFLMKFSTIVFMLGGWIQKGPKMC